MEFKYQTVALDYGTSYSTLAYFDESGNIALAKDEKNKEYIPSIFSCVDKMRIGDEAKQYRSKDPSNTLSYIKRIIGREFSDQYLQPVLEKTSFRVVSGTNGKAECKVKWQGEERQVTPETVVSLFVDYMCNLITVNPIYQIHNIILTVPAHFDNVQRNCLRTAVMNDTRTNVTLLEEPVAAAISFAKDNDLNNKRIMVYDLGGGTFDVSVMDVNNNNYSVVFTSGESFLGGVDVTNAMYDYLVEWFKENHKLDITFDSILNQRIYDIAEEIKIYFSENDSYYKEIDISPATIINDDDEEIDEVEFEMVITEYDEIIKPVISKTMDILDGVMNEPCVKARPVDMIALIGGSTNIGLVRELLMQRYPTAELLRTDDPRAAVAKGALIYGEQQNMQGKSRSFINGFIVVNDYESIHIGNNSVSLESIDDEIHLKNDKKDLDDGSFINLDDLVSSSKTELSEPVVVVDAPQPVVVVDAPQPVVVVDAPQPVVVIDAPQPVIDTPQPVVVNAPQPVVVNAPQPVVVVDTPQPVVVVDTPQPTNVVTTPPTNVVTTPPTNVVTAPSTNVEVSNPTNVVPGNPEECDEVDEVNSELTIDEKSMFTCYAPDNHIICKRENGRIYILDHEEFVEVVEDKYEKTFPFKALKVLINTKFVYIRVDEEVNLFINKNRLSIRNKEIIVQNIPDVQGISPEFGGSLVEPLTESYIRDNSSAMNIEFVTGLDIGIDLKDGMMGVLIPRGTKTSEAMFVKRYNANRNFPTEIRTTIYQGNHLYSRDNIPVGTLRIRNLRRRPDTNRGCIDIRVSFDSNNLLKTEIKQFDEEEFNAIPIVNKLIWNEEEILRNQREAEETRHFDEMFREYYDMKALVDDLIRSYRVMENADQTLISRWIDFMNIYKPTTSLDLTPAFMDRWKAHSEEVKNTVGTIFDLY